MILCIGILCGIVSEGAGFCDAIFSCAIFRDTIFWRAEATELRVEPGDEALDERLLGGVGGRWTARKGAGVARGGRTVDEVVLMVRRR